MSVNEQCIWSKLWTDVDELRQAVAAFVARNSAEWLIERHAHCTPREAFEAATARQAA